MEKIKVLALNVKDNFKNWIDTRGGVSVWHTVNLSNPGAGYVFTPFRDIDGSENEKPRWDLALKEVVKDIDRFLFAKSAKEVKRIRIYVRMGSQGTMLKLTDSSTDRLYKALDLFPGSFYKFENDEAVIYMPEFEEET